MNDEIVRQFRRMFEAMREVCQAPSQGPQGLEARRLCLHAVEAVENYMTDSPPADYGGNLKHGVRSNPESPPIPPEELARCLEEAWVVTEAHLGQLDLSKEKDVWGMSPLRRVLYVMRHTQHHLGQVSTLIGGTVDVNRLCRS